MLKGVLRLRFRPLSGRKLRSGRQSCFGIRELAAGGQARRESWGELGGEDAVLSGFQVVGRAVEVEDLGFGVVEGEAGAPVAVAGLPDGAGVDHVARGRFEL